MTKKTRKDIEQNPYAVLTWGDMKVTIICTKITPFSVVDAILLTANTLEYSRDKLERSLPKIDANLVDQMENDIKKQVFQGIVQESKKD